MQKQELEIAKSLWPQVIDDPRPPDREFNPSATGKDLISHRRPQAEMNSWGLTSPFGRGT